MNKDKLHEAIANTAEVKVWCELCDGRGWTGPNGDCPKCARNGFTILKLGATDIVERLPKVEGRPVEYRNILTK